jgi:putative membrane protein
MKLEKSHILILILIIFHAVGIGGIGFELDPEMVKLSWMNLSLTAALVLINRSHFNMAFIIYSIIIFTLGMLVEIIGVKTGYPFGVYHYGESLGWKIMGVPLAIGLNWWMLTYITCQITNKFLNNDIFKAILAAGLMLGLDFFIEPLCSTLDFWHWQNEDIPLQNYLSWYIIAFIFTLAYFKLLKNEETNKLGIWAYGVQLSFFILLNSLL